MTVLHQIDPIALDLGTWNLPLLGTVHPQIHWYGVMYLLAFAAAWFLGRRRVRAGRLPGVDEQAFGDLVFYGAVGAVLGGRVGYILFYDLPSYIAEPLQVFKIWQGGMSFHGGLLGVVLAAWLWSRRHKTHLADTMDFVAPLVPPGLGFGRLGNFINGELWGKPTNGDWGVVFPSSPELQAVPMEQLKAQFASGALDIYARHPSQLYQAGLEGLAMFVILWWFSSRPRPRYAVMGMFALLYGIFRFLVEFVRVPDAQIGDAGYLAMGWLTMGQVLSLPLVALGLYWLWYSRRQPTLQPTTA